MITYFYRDKKPETEKVTVPEEVTEKLREWGKSLEKVWEEYGGIITMTVIIVLIVIACVASGGAAVPTLADK